MAWNYNPAELSTNEVYQIRLEVGDTDPNNQRLQDEEITQAISVERNFWCAAARCAEMISRVYYSKADVKLGRSMMVTYTKMADQYGKMAAKLRQKSLGTIVPWVGGMNLIDKAVYVELGAFVPSMFTKNMMENPWTGGYTPDTLGPSPTFVDDSGQEF